MSHYEKIEDGIQYYRPTEEDEWLPLPLTELLKDWRLGAEKVEAVLKEHGNYEVYLNADNGITVKLDGELVWKLAYMPINVLKT